MNCGSVGVGWCGVPDYSGICAMCAESGAGYLTRFLAITQKNKGRY